MTKYTSAAAAADQSNSILSRLAAEYESARNDRFEPKPSGARPKLSLREAIARDMRGQTDYGIAEEAKFQQERSDALLKLANEAVLDWRSVLLALRARVERFSFSVDYLSFLAAFCALVFSITLALATTIGPQYYFLAGIVAVLGVYSFMKGATLRRRILVYKELLNLIDANFAAMVANRNER